MQMMLRLMDMINSMRCISANLNAQETRSFAVANEATFNDVINVLWSRSKSKQRSRK